MTFHDFSPFVNFENGFIALVYKVNQSVLKNLSVLSRMEWISRWKASMAMHNFSQKLWSL